MMDKTVAFNKKKFTVIFSLLTIISFLIPVIPGIYRNFQYPSYINFLNNDTLQLILGICFPLFGIVALSLFLMYLGEKFLHGNVEVSRYKGIKTNDIEINSSKRAKYTGIFFLCIPTILFLYTAYMGFPYYKLLLLNIFYIPLIGYFFRK